MKRILLAVTVLSLVAAPATSALAKPKPKPKPLPKCLAWTDAASDAKFFAPASDPALEITNVRLSTGADKSLLAAITVAKFADRPLAGAGNRFQVTFTAAGKVVDVYYKIGPAREAEKNAFYQSGIRVDGTFSTDAVTATVKDNTVTMAVKLSALKGAVGKAVDGAKATGITAYAMASYVATNETWDTAEAPGTFTIGGACA